MADRISRPDTSEYASFYETYVGLVPDRDLQGLLREQRDELLQILTHVPAARETYCYEEGKWSIREVLGHIVDTERVFVYRLLHIARGQSAPLPGMEQDEFAAAAAYADRPLGKIAEEYRTQRDATLSLLDSLPTGVLQLRGLASGFEFSARALAYIIAGHDRHHQRVLRERYLS